MSSGRSALQHLLRNVDAEDMRRSLFARPSAEPSEAASQVQDIEAAQVRQQRAQRRPFRGVIESIHGASQLAVRLEELVVVINILSHRSTVDGFPTAQDRKLDAAAIEP